MRVSSTSSGFDITFDTHGTLDALRSQMAAMPQQIERAQQRALRKLATWVRRRILQTLSKSIGTPQKYFNNWARARFRMTEKTASISIWVGSNDIPAHHLGPVTWNRSMRGAKANKLLFPGTWSWPNAVRTAGLIMRRTGRFGRIPTRAPRNRGRRKQYPKLLERIDKEYVEIDVLVFDGIEAAIPDINEKFTALLLQELNYALRHEQARSEPRTRRRRA